MRLSAALLLVVLAVSACDEDDTPEPSKPEPAGAEMAPCDVGGPAKYIRQLSFPESPTIFGCARLASGPVVELSAHDDRLGDRKIVCINRRYSVVYVPSICPSPRDLTGAKIEVITTEQPRQGRQTRRLEFGFVVSGPVSSDAQGVSVRYKADRAAQAQAAVLRVDRRLASSIGVNGDFGYFIAELPASAACDRVVVRAETADRLIGTDSAPARANVCNRAQ